MAWWNFAKKIYGNPPVSTIVFLVLAAIVLYYLLQELTIVEIFGGVTFTVLLVGVSYAVFSKEMLAWGESMMKKKDMMRRSWLVILIWLALSLWVLKEIFFK